MEYVPTKAERDILIAIKNGDFSSKKSPIKQAECTPTELRALEGCIAKGFIRKVDGTYTLTQSGAAQI